MKKDLSPRQRRVLEFIRERGEVLSWDIASFIKDDKNTARNLAEQLLRRKLIKKKKTFGVIEIGEKPIMMRHNAKIVVYYPVETEDWKKE